MTQRRDFIKLSLALTLAGAALASAAQPAPVTLLNVSYDPTRALDVEISTAFA